jgi:hypothetical protein
VNSCNISQLSLEQLEPLPLNDDELLERFGACAKLAEQIAPHDLVDVRLAVDEVTESASEA